MASGAINTSISTDCNTCGLQEGSTWSVTTAGAGPFPTTDVQLALSWRVSLNMKRKFRMKEGETLDLMLGWENSTPFGDPRKVQPRLQVKGDLKAFVSS